jgi:hypothetical protein
LPDRLEGILPSAGTSPLDPAGTATGPRSNRDDRPLSPRIPRLDRGRKACATLRELQDNAAVFDMAESDA